jgi:hypothetical protein
MTFAILVEKVLWIQDRFEWMDMMEVSFDKGFPQRERG